MNDDLKYYQADDPFVILSPDQCVLLLCALIFIGFVLRDYL